MELRMAASLRILIATPAANGQVTTVYAESIAHLCKALAQQRIDYGYQTTSYADLELSRNLLASAALAQSFTHILFVDADMGFKPRAVQRLIGKNVAVVGAVCAKRDLPLFAILDDVKPEHKEAGNGWQRAIISRHMQFSGDPLKVDGRIKIEQHDGFAIFQGIGMGLTLISCDALRQIVDKNLVHRQIEVGKVTYAVYGFFDRQRHSNGDLYGEDYSFCLRWQKCDGEIWALLDEPILHVGAYNYVGIYPQTVT